MDNEISVKALAKVNLGLDVVRKREDGYHEVRMIMQTIHLFDRLEIIAAIQSGAGLPCRPTLRFCRQMKTISYTRRRRCCKEEFDDWGRYCM